MESFIKRSQRNKLWAHARNKTTEKLLVGTLQHLEEEYDRECRHYLRNRHRIQRELVELRSLTDNFNIANSKDKENALVKKTILCRGAPTVVAQVQLMKESEENKCIGYTSENNNSLQSTTERYIGKNVQFKESNTGDNKSVFDECHNKFFVNGDPLGDHKETLNIDLSKKLNRIKTSSPQLVNVDNESTTLLRARACSLTWQEGQRATPRFGHVGKYKEGQKGSVTCQHFPCQIPKTYHSLGYRRDDLIPWLSETSERDVRVQSTRDKPTSTNVSKRHKLYNVTSSEYFDIITTNSQNDNSLPSWRKNSLKLKVQFQPIEGPIFMSKPSDPILEQIRSGSLEEIRGLPSMTRKTVSAKLRGLKQLVVEMKYRNDLTKPADWAVNYGARLPTRVLLNPAFPV